MNIITETTMFYMCCSNADLPNMAGAHLLHVTVKTKVK